MPRKLTGYIDENDCIGDSLGPTGGGIKSTINDNSLALDLAIQELSGGTIGNFAVGGNLNVNSNTIITGNLSASNVTVTNTVTASRIIIREVTYVQPARLTGGNITPYDVVYDGFNWRVHTFTTVGASTLTVTQPGEVEFLLVAGGGSGGNRNTTNANGGGGGGGIVHKQQHYVTPGTYQVFVGAGGAAIPFSTSLGGNNGQNSTLFGYVAFGGGGGASTDVEGSKAGGSSGGAASRTNGVAPSLQTDLSGARGYGNIGGAICQDWTGGGGGGAGGPGIPGGHNGVSIWAGDGGYGMPFVISGTQRFYAGGGGGGANSSERSGMGWHGGGRGFGSTRFYAHTNYPLEINSETGGWGTPDAIDGTGGGGGAGTYWSNNSGGPNWTNRGSGKGGSGIIIVRYRL
jgi:hypothetical protein